MRRYRQILPTLTILAGGGLLIAGVYRAVPAAVGMLGVAYLFAGGIWALRRSSAERRAFAAAHWASIDGGAGGDLPHGGHHGGFDGGGFFDGGGGHHGGGHGGH